MRPIVDLRRFLDGLRRPSKPASIRRMHQRGETFASLTIRDATPADIPALATLHVTTFNETHTLFGIGPTYAVREGQYRQKFATTDGSWFALVAVGPGGELVGFAVGEPADDARYQGELSKIYVLRAYQRLGLGRRLVGHVVRRFLSQGITSMMLFSQADNPSIAFFDAMGGQRLLSDAGEFHGGYAWPELRTLAARCPPD